MPFIGKDWRSPGEAWVKTETLGWQRMKIIESQLYSSCLQSHPACSWPPRAQSGQHMANNCGNRYNENTTEHEESINQAGGYGGGSLSSGSSACASSDSSNGSSCAGSTSASPTGSPEKNSPHHLHPITISSPYGRYSCCAHHHHIDSPCVSPKNYYYHQNDSNKNSNHDNLRQEYDAQMSRSLSRELVKTPDSTSGSSTSCRKLRYNKSCSDFRSSQQHQTIGDDNQTSTSINYTNESSTSHQLQSSLSDRQQSEDRSCSSTPILLRNGLKINDDDLPGHQGTQKQSQLDSATATATDLTRKLNNEKHKQDNRNSQPMCNVCCCSFNQQCQQNPHPFKEPQPRTAPHCRISVRTREVAMYNTISEAFYRLDFCNAIHDIRRFNYICKLLHLLITQNLTSLSGCATKVLFTMLEQVAWEVSTNKRNIHVLKNLLNELKQMIQKYYCWGRPIGSSLLWQQHFDTIERISQIVDGIELSPPKDDSNRVTFEKLPAEMVREILLRLNDYRDLVNSAQASPLMRTMIDSQYIWQQLCRYHFTNQQLRLALESHDLNLTKRSTLRGVKYARTSSSDGRSSYRSPVAHKQQQLTISSPKSSTRQQIEQTSGRRNVNRKDSSGSSSISSSYVTKAIRIFDRDEGGSSASRSNISFDGGQSRSHNSNIKNELNNCKPLRQYDEKSQREVANQQQQQQSGNRTSHEIDWERVFHQLRKRFDLKEEYADCLLLCRHCRCLFWKSFGHPCIKNDELPDEDCFGLNEPAKLNDNRIRHPSQNGRRDCDERFNQNVRPNDGFEQYHNNSSHRATNRPSVASLSRSFDNRANQRMNHLADSENIAPAPAPNEQQSNGGRFNNQAAPLRQPFDDLNAQIQERNAIINNRRRQNANGANNNATNSVKRDELVPKHVTITPQAFLKFFSL